MSKQTAFAALFCFLVLAPAFATDVATFVNLGFSGDSRTFLFGQYGINAETSTPYADTFLVDVMTNRFVANGVTNRQFATVISPGQDGIGGLFSVIREQAAVIDRYAIDHLQQGRLVYLYMNGDVPRSRVEFRDFAGQARYVVQLIQTPRGSGDTLESSFHLQVNAANAGGGNARTYTVGLPNYYRPGVGSYLIKQVLVSPDENALVFVIEMHYPSEAGRRVRYIVETTNLR